MSSLLSSKNRLLFLHTMAFLGVGSFIGAFFAGEIHKFQLYMKYRREVSYYMRWKIEREVVRNVG